MKLSHRDMTIGVVGFLVVGLGVRYAMDRTGANGTNSAGHAPLEESSAASFGSFATQGISAPVNMLGIGPNGFTDETRLLHFFHPESPLPLRPQGQSYVSLKHRYPTVSGTNISTLIHRGYSPMMVPTPRDYDWLVNPPTESMFGV